MTVLLRLRSTILLLSLVVLPSCGDPPAAPRNLLLVTVDTLRADHLGGYGYRRATSPELDRLFAESVVFDDAHSSSSWTLPAFASLFTSLHSSTHGCFDYRSALDPSFTTLAETLAGHGYRTAGVVSHVFLRQKHGLPQGFTEFDASLVETVREAHNTISSPYVTDRAIEHLDGFAADPDGAPWFLWLHYFDPHAAYQKHEGTSDRFGDRPVDRYDGEIAFTDRHVGRVIRRLRELDLHDDTIVSVISDHGEEFDDHGRQGHGKSLFREVVRVPFSIRVPGIPPRRVSQTVHMVDFAPTFLAMVGLSWPADEPRHGRSLLAAMRGERLPQRGALSELRLSLRKDATLASLVLGRWKLIVEYGRAPSSEKHHMLFDRRADPGEMRNLVDTRPDVVTRMEERLDAAVRAAEKDRRRRESGETSLAPLAPLEDSDLENLERLGYLSGPDRDR